jgi:pyruvate/2-oxoglutarate dehydrogenase complex dihydrolipoamide acyltransferase (E2) component
MEYVLPDLGEGLVGATIVAWYVDVGDRVVEDESIVLVETDKAEVELPSPVTGTIIELGADELDVVGVGGLLAVIAATDDPMGPVAP